MAIYVEFMLNLLSVSILPFTREVINEIKYFIEIMNVRLLKTPP